MIPRLDRSRTAGVISPLLFGQNLEHTRSCVWRGLSAQIIRNRKFAGKSGRNGVAADWYAIGLAVTYYELERQGAYTCRYREDNHRGRRNELSCQRAQSLTAGQEAGIGQNGLPLMSGREYELRAALRTDRLLPITVRVAGPSGAAFERTFEAPGGDWREFEFRFACPRGSLGDRLEIVTRGAGNLRVGCVSLLPAGHYLGMRPDVIALLREIGTTVLRWPGGNFAGDYRWLDGLLPVDRRGPLMALTESETLPHTGGFDMHEIGTDQFIALCRQVGAEPFITINFAWDSAEDAAAWVEYCNGRPESRWGSLRAERGHPEPYGVKLWSLGNEIGYEHMEGPRAPAAYAEKAVAVAQAMRRADPSIQLVMSGHWENEDWFTAGLPPLAGVVDHVSYHHYTPQIADYEGQPALDSFRRIALMPTVSVFPALLEMRRKMAPHIPPGRQVGISFDEWNIWYAWYRTVRTPDGIHAAAFLNALLRHASAAGVTIGCYFQAVNEGAIEVGPEGSALTMVGEVMALMKAHAGNTLLGVGEQDPHSDLDITASLDAAGRSVVTLVNRSAERDVEAAIELPGPCSVAENVLLSAPDLPASRFARSQAAVSCEGGTLRATVPRFGLARLILK